MIILYYIIYYKMIILMVDIDGCVCFSPSYRSKRRWKISCFWPRRLWVRWLIQKNDESRLARETFDAFSSHKNLPSLSDSVHKPRSGSLTSIYIKFETNSRQQIFFYLTGSSIDWFNPIRTTGIRSKTYTCKKSMGGHSDNFCIFLNIC